MAISKVKSASIITDAIGPTQLNEAANYDFTGTVTGAGGVNTPSFLAYASSNQTVGHESWTKVTLGSELFDTDSAFASNKFTVPTAEGGKYWFNGCVNAYAGANNLKRIIMRLYKNGSGFAYFSSNNW